MTGLLRERQNMQSTLRRFQDKLWISVSSSRFWAIFGVMMVLFAFIGPFGTFDRLDLPMRFFYWATTMLGSWCIAIITVTATLVLLPNSVPNFIAVITGAALASFPIALYLHIVINQFILLPEANGYLYQLGYALPISLAFGVIVYFALSSDYEDDTGTILDRDNRLMARLPHEKRGPIMHLSMQDHYVQVTTTKGTELVLMRMADAVAELASTEGLQVHRSHWVAREHVAGTRRESGRTIVIMKDGAEFPISRTFAKQAKDAGL